MLCFDGSVLNTNDNAIALIFNCVYIAGLLDEELKNQLAILDSELAVPHCVSESFLDYLKDVLRRDATSNEVLHKRLIKADLSSDRRRSTVRISALALNKSASTGFTYFRVHRNQIRSLLPFPLHLYSRSHMPSDSMNAVQSSVAYLSLLPLAECLCWEDEDTAN